jgi:hypothetical protein
VLVPFVMQARITSWPSKLATDTHARPFSRTLSMILLGGAEFEGGTAQITAVEEVLRTDHPFAIRESRRSAASESAFSAWAS